jgi:hypothetical protein
MESEKEKAVKGHQNGQNAPQSNRGEKCLSKFTSSNGSVYGSLTLDIRKAGDYSQPLPVDEGRYKYVMSGSLLGVELIPAQKCHSCASCFEIL